MCSDFTDCWKGIIMTDIFEHFLLVQDNPFEGGYEAAFKEVVSGITGLYGKRGQG